MAQVVKLKRTSVQGKVPTISNLELGELAINTYDGRIFFEKNDGQLKIEQIVTSNSETTGSISLTGNFTSSNALISNNLNVDGNVVIGGTVTAREFYTELVSSSIIYESGSTKFGDTSDDVHEFTGSVQISGSIISNSGIFGQINATNGLISGSSQVDLSNVSNNTTDNVSEGTNLYYTDTRVKTKLDTEGVISGSSQLTSSYDDRYILSGSITDTTWDNISGKPYGIVSSSDQLLNVATDFGTGRVSGDNFGNTDGTSTFTGSFSGDGSNLTNIDVGEVSTVTSSYSNTDSFTVNHEFGSKNIIVSVYGSNDEQIIPKTVSLTDINNVSIELSEPSSGFVVVAKGGHLVSGSAGDSNNLNGQPASYYLDYTNLNNIPSGLVSGSSQITNGSGILSGSIESLLPVGVISGSSQIISLTTYREDVSGSSQYTITHSLDEEYPIVQAYNTTTKKQEHPSEIESLSSSQIQITFSSTFDGKVVVKK